MLRTLSMLSLLACTVTHAQAAMVTSTTITAVETEPSAPFANAFVDIHVAADVGTPMNGSVVEVHGSDGSFSSCQVGTGMAFCPLTFAASGTVALTASYLGDGIEDPSTSVVYMHTVSAAPLLLGASQNATVGVAWSLTVSGLSANVTATIDFGDGTTGTLAADGGGSGSTSHLFTTEGAFAVVVTDPMTGSKATTLVDVFTATPPISVLSTGLNYAGAGVSLGQAGISAYLDQSGAGATTPVVLAVAVYPSDPTPSPLPGSAFDYDVRVAHVSGGSLYVVFNYPADLTTPSLEYYDAAAGRFVAVVSSSKQTSSRTDPLAHNITVSFDDTSTPALTQLTGTVLSTRAPTPVPDMAAPADLGVVPPSDGGIVDPVTPPHDDEGCAIGGGAPHRPAALLGLLAALAIARLRRRRVPRA